MCSAFSENLKTDFDLVSLSPDDPALRRRGHMAARGFSADAFVFRVAHSVRRIS